MAKAASGEGRAGAKPTTMVEVKQQDLQVAELAVVDVPAYQASSVQIASTGIDVSFLFSSLRPVLHADGAGVGLVPAAAVVMSRGAALDLHLALSSVLEVLERDFGPLETPFMKDRREKGG